MSNKNAYYCILHFFSDVCWTLYKRCAELLLYNPVFCVIMKIFYKKGESIADRRLD